MDFNPQQQHSLLSKMGYTGPVDPKMMEAFLSSNPGAAARMGKFSRAAQKIGMAAGGTVTGKFTVRRVGGQGEWEYQVRGPDNKIVATHPTQAKADADAKARNATATGTTATPTTTGTTTTPTTTGTTTTPTTTTPAPTLSPGATLTEAIIQDPTKVVSAAPVTTAVATPDTLIGAGVGQAGAVTMGPTQTAEATTAAAPTKIEPTMMTAATVSEDVAKAAETLKPVQGTVSEKALAEAAQQTESSISGMQADQGAAYILQNPVKREIQDGEMISGSAVDATKVNDYIASIQAAEATPSQKATVQGQLEGLMNQFEGGKTPAWAAGAMRAAQATLAQRGLGASSMAGQAVIQAAMESALPIAQVDAATIAQFEAQNLSNRQQTALFAAQQRAAFLQQDFDQTFQTRVLNAAKVADIANMNFTAEQNIALENSRAINTMNIANLDARNAMTLAKAAALANLDIANLNNRQQAAVQNAQAFLQMDLTNLDNAQQTAITKFQANVQALLTDSAAENAARQLNVTSKNQADQFFADLSARVTMFNTEQVNTIKQFNAGEKNASARLKAQLDAARAEFNAKSSLEIAQANAKWRQDIATAATAAQNDANRDAALAANTMTVKAMEEVWQKERDTIAYAFTALESEKDRAAELLLADKKEAAAESAGRASFLTKLVFGF